MKENPIIVALDMESELVLAFLEKLQGLGIGFKVGLQLFTAAGPDIIRRIHETGNWVFLDLKFHDIPNTVAKAVGSAAKHGVRMLNMHASGGLKMMIAGREAAEKTAAEIGGKPPLVLGVTLLTSLDYQALADIGLAPNVTGSNAEEIKAENSHWLKQRVIGLATAAKKAGLGGVICSPLEVADVRVAVGAEMQLVTPGIRGLNDPPDDQKRTLSAKEAIAAGANWLVIGRPIYGAPDPCAAAEAILQTLN